MLHYWHGDFITCTEDQDSTVNDWHRLESVENILAWKPKVSWGRKYRNNRLIVMLNCKLQILHQLQECADENIDIDIVRQVRIPTTSGQYWQVEMWPDRRNTLLEARQGNWLEADVKSGLMLRMFPLFWNVKLTGGWRFEKCLSCTLFMVKFLLLIVNRSIKSIHWGLMDQSRRVSLIHVDSDESVCRV